MALHSTGGASTSSPSGSSVSIGGSLALQQLGDEIAQCLHRPSGCLRRLEVFAEQRVVERFCVLVLSSRLVQALADAVERLYPA